MTELIDFLKSSGFYNLGWQNIVMLAIGLGLMYLAIRRKWEPYELLPIGLGIVIVNLPLTGIAITPTDGTGVQDAGVLGVIFHFGLSFWNILPPIIFIGIGALTDFSPLIANPKTLLLGAAAQVGIFVAFWGALGVTELDPGRFGLGEAASIGIIGGADGPTTIFLSAKLAPEILGITAVIAYTYMAAVPFIQPPIMKLLTTKKERQIVMKPTREVSKAEKLIFPILLMIIILLVVPRAAPLVAMLVAGNLFRESGVVPRLTESASNELLNIATIFLMLTVGTQLKADLVFTLDTLLILGLGLVAFACGTMGGILFAKAMNLFSRDKINPLIGSAGVSAVPMAARISHQVGQEGVAGVIGSAVVAGVFISLIR